MTTAILHGDPGCYKTGSLVSEYGVPALYDGRTVVTNIRGFNDLKKIEKVYGKKLPESAKLIAIPFTRDGFRKMGTFFHWAPSGAIILFDEIQRVYPTRLKNLTMYDCNPPRDTGYVDEATGVKEDIATVEEAFDCHRHMNWDIYLSTPNIEKVHKEIRQVAEFGYRQKGYATVSKLLALILGDFKRVKHNAENKGNTDTCAIVSSSHRIDKRAFRCYQSTATGVAKSTHTKAGILGQPKLLLFIGIFLAGMYNIFSTYLDTGTINPMDAGARKADNKQPVDAPLTLDSEPVLLAASNVLPSGVSPASNVHSGAVPIRPVNQSVSLEVFKKLESWVGTIKQSDNEPVQLLEIKGAKDTYQIDSQELAQLGVIVQPFQSFLVVEVGQHSRIIYPARYEYQPNESMTF